MKQEKESLTPEEIQLMYQVRKEWIDRCDSGAQIDQEAATKWINWLYTSSRLDKPKKIIYMSSPLGAQYAFNLLVRKNVGENVWRNIRQNFWRNIRQNIWQNVEQNIRQNVRQNVWRNIRQNVEQNVWQNVEQNIRENVGENVWQNVEQNVWQNVRQNVRENVGENVEQNEKLQYTLFSGYGNISDYGWIAFYDFFSRIGVINHEGLNAFTEGLKSNVYDMIQLKEVCIVCELPSVLKRDEKGRLHSVDGPAIAWRDGYEIYYIHGIPFKREEFLDFTSGKLTAKDVLKEENQDKKRVLAMVYGNEKLLNDLGAKPLSEEQDDCGYMMRLYSIDLGEEEKLVIYEGVDPAKDEKVYLRVPPEFENKTPLEAKCWTFPELWDVSQKLGQMQKFKVEA